MQARRRNWRLSHLDPLVLTGPNEKPLTGAEVLGDLLRFLNSPRAFCRRHRIPFGERVQLLQRTAQEWVVRRLLPYWNKAHRQEYVRFMRPEVRSRYAEELEPEARELAEASGAELEELPRPAHLINVHRSFGHEFHPRLTPREALRKVGPREALHHLSIEQRRAITWVYNRLHLLAGRVRRCDIPECRTPGGRFFLSDGKTSACPLCRNRLTPKQRWRRRNPDAIRSRGRLRGRPYRRSRKLRGRITGSAHVQA